MEQNKIFIVFLLLTIYLLTINKRLFMVTFLFLISFLFYLNNKAKLSLTFLVIYLLTLIINKRNEKFRVKVERFQNKDINLSSNRDLELNMIDNDEEILLTKSSFTQEIDREHIMTMENYQETFFVLNSLLENEYVEKNKENIEKILIEYKINNLFDLSINILNKDENVIFSNKLL